MTDYAQATRALAALQHRNVTILGYGDAGAAHALCLRDSGVDVRIGLSAAHPDRAAAEGEGFAVRDPSTACEEADLVMLLVAPQDQARVYSEALADNLVPGDVLLVADGFALRYGYIVPPVGVDVGLVAPVGDARLLRREFAEGRGVPMVAAVVQDASGRAWEEVLGYAAGLGGLRAGIVASTLVEAVDAAAFGAAAVARQGIPDLLRGAYDELVAAGYGPDVAYLACVQQARTVLDELAARGLAQAPDAAGEWPTFAATRPRDGLLRGLQDGSLAAAFVVDEAAGGQTVAAATAAAAAHRIERVGAPLRAVMPWLRLGEEASGERWR